MLKILYVTDTNGQKQFVQIPYELWEKNADALLEILFGAKVEALANFEEFLRYWDFRYAYNPGVECPNCGTVTEDWQNDPAHPFWLANANLGGLLVFHCRKCGTTIRQKHFKDHVAFEHDKPTQIN